METIEELWEDTYREVAGCCDPEGSESGVWVGERIAAVKAFALAVLEKADNGNAENMHLEFCGHRGFSTDCPMGRLQALYDQIKGL